MRDILAKTDTLRTATAEATLKVSPATIAKLNSGDLPKGDPLPVARTAALIAAKLTPQLIPYCHNVPIQAMTVDFKVGIDSIKAVASVSAIYRTGVEMEALTAASVAALNVYDMLKIIDEDMEITGVRLIEKRGGKTDYRRLPDWPITAAVVVVSDSVSAGTSTDTSGSVVIERLRELGLEPQPLQVIPDEPAQIERWVTNEARVDLLIFTGGTGLSARDITPETVEPLLEQRLPGVEEAIRRYGQDRTPYAMLSRSLAGVRGETLILCLPGSPSGALDAVNAVFPAILHAVNIIHGEAH